MLTRRGARKASPPSTTTKNLTTSFEEAVLVKTMETNYYHVTRLDNNATIIQRRTRSFDFVIVVIDDGESLPGFLLHLQAFPAYSCFQTCSAAKLLEFTLCLLIRCSACNVASRTNCLEQPRGMEFSVREIH
jgi:hypothetical protein